MNRDDVIVCRSYECNKDTEEPVSDGTRSESWGTLANGVGMTITSSNNKIVFEAGEDANLWLHNLDLADDGRTIGEMYRNVLHKRLSDWIERVKK